MVLRFLENNRLCVKPVEYPNMSLDQALEVLKSVTELFKSKLGSESQDAVRNRAVLEMKAKLTTLQNAEKKLSDLDVIFGMPDQQYRHESAWYLVHGGTKSICIYMKAPPNQWLWSQSDGKERVTGNLWHKVCSSRGRIFICNANEAILRQVTSESFAEYKEFKDCVRKFYQNDSCATPDCFRKHRTGGSLCGSCAANSALDWDEYGV